MIRKLLILFLPLTCVAQFQPPAGNVTLMVSPATADTPNIIVRPARETFINANFTPLTPSTGIVGDVYNGLNASTWAVDTDWLVENYHQALTFSTGLTLNSGTTYNGQAAKTVVLDRDYLESVIKETAFTVNAFQFMIDTTASVNLFDATQTRTTSGSVTLDLQNYSYDYFGTSAYPFAVLPDGVTVTEMEDGNKYVNAINQSIVITDSANLGMNFSYSVCFKFTTTNWNAIPASTGAFFLNTPSLGADTSRIGMSIYKGGANRLRCLYRSVAGTSAVMVESSIATNLANTVYAVCLVVDSANSQLILYINGQLAGAVATPNIAFAEATTSDIEVHTHDTYALSYADVRVFNGRALTAEEAMAYYNGEAIDNPDISLANHIDLANNEWLSGYNTAKLNYQNGYANAQERTMPFTVSYIVPKLTQWTDAELKAMNGNQLLYWVSTQWGEYMSTDYENHPARDPNAKIWYTVSGSANDGRNWILYEHSAQYPTIYAHARQYIPSGRVPRIGNIIIQPNLAGTTIGGTSIAEIFGTVEGNTPTANSYIYLKCSPTGIERDEFGEPLWRAFNALTNATQQPKE